MFLIFISIDRLINMGSGCLRVEEGKLSPEYNTNVYVLSGRRNGVDKISSDRVSLYRSR